MADEGDVAVPVLARPVPAPVEVAVVLAEFEVVPVLDEYAEPLLALLLVPDPDEGELEEYVPEVGNVL